MNRIIVTLAALSLCASAFADIQVEIKDGFGEISTFSSNGRLVRIDGGKIEGFIIANFSSGEFFMVDLKRNQVMRTSLDQVDASKSVAPISISLKDKGGGQRIAGYLTRKYEMIADGEYCGSVYTSTKLIQNNEVRAIFESMRNMQQFSSRMMGGMSDIIPLCQRAGMQMADVIESSGAPLRTVDKKGKLISEVVGVDTDKKFADDHYELPAGMAVVDMTEQMNQAAQQSQQMMQNMPDMDELIKQMQQNDGQMSEEMKQQLMEQMQQMQQMQQ